MTCYRAGVIEAKMRSLRTELYDIQVATGIRFHNICFQWESIVSHKYERRHDIAARQFAVSWSIKRVGFKGFEHR